MKVYLVKEHWDNCDEYELYDEKETIICVAVNHYVANSVIEKRKKYLIDKFNKSKLYYDSFEEVDKENTLPGMIWTFYDCGLVFDWDTDTFGKSIFGTFSRGHDAFYWRIEEHNLMES